MASSNSGLPFESRVPANVRQAFVQQVRAISSRLGIQAGWLMRIMMSESGLDPRAINRFTGGDPNTQFAIGLIQWLPESAKFCHTTVQELQRLAYLPDNQGWLAQLPFVERYFTPVKGKLKSVTDLYLYTFYPSGIGKPDNWTLGSDRSPAFAQLVAKVNPGFNTNRDLKITIGEFRKAVFTLPAFKGMSASEMAGSTKKTNLLALILIASFFFIFYHYRKSIFNIFQPE